MLPVSDICAVILSGGQGTRLRPVLPDSQKVLAEVMGRPFITFLLDKLASTGIKRIVLCTGYKGESVRNKLGNSYRSMRLIYSQENTPIGTGGALRHALKQLLSDPVLVMNGDSFININLSTFISWFRGRDTGAALALAYVTDTSRYGRVRLGQDHMVKQFYEKNGSHLPGWINAGIYLVTKELIESIPCNREYSLEQEFFPSLIDKGLSGYRYSGDFIDIGTPSSYAGATLYFQQLKDLS